MNQNEINFCRQVAISEDYEDFFATYNILDTFIEQVNPVCYQTAGADYLVFHQSRDTENPGKYIAQYGYSAIPKVYGLLDTSSVESTGTLRIRRQPYLSLYGSGVIIGFVDTGIDYRNPLFLNADNTTRILEIWDQGDQTGELPQGINYGSIYTRDQINQALASENPLDIVPSIDTNGHGTFLAGIAAGNENPENDFTGMAPGVDIVSVKLKPAKRYLREYYGISETVPAFESTDIIMGIHYLFGLATRLRRPMVICIGLGTNTGDHTGRDFLSSYLDDYADTDGICIITSAGNEGNLAHHFRGKLTGIDSVEPMEIRVGQDENSFRVGIWVSLPNRISISIVSPTGEVIPRIPANMRTRVQYNLSFEKSRVIVQYFTNEERTGDEHIYVQVEDPIEGVWTINVYSDTDNSQVFDAWLPMEGFISPDTYFIKPDPDLTITQPGNAMKPITVTAYNHVNGSIFISASRGPTRLGLIEPDIAAPGVDVYGPTGLNRFGTKTGTSVAAAHVAGAAALLMEWGVVQGNNVRLDSIAVRQLLITGAQRDKALNYPNNIWGYGTLDIYNTFNSIRVTSEPF